MAQTDPPLPKPYINAPVQLPPDCAAPLLRCVTGYVQWAFIKDLPREKVEEALTESARGKMKIEKPVWMASNPHVFQTDVAALQFGVTGMSVSPCAIPVNPVGVAVDPTVSHFPASHVLCMLGYSLKEVACHRHLELRV
jgi:hypothetical protein